MTDDEPSECVHEVTHHHLLFGIINIDSDEDNDLSRYIADKEAFMIKNYVSISDGIFAGLTGGIYTPTTTKIYLPK